MKSRDSQMNRSASAYAGPAREGYARTGAGTIYASREGKAAPATTRLTHEQIAERARTLWLASGCLPGRDVQNWLEAEVQLKSELKSH
jgi:hypothetical protein